MPGRQAKIYEGSLIGAQPVGHDAAGCETLFPEQLSHQPLRCVGVASLLRQEVQNLSLIVNSAPKPVALIAVFCVLKPAVELQIFTADKRP